MKNSFKLSVILLAFITAFSFQSCNNDPVEVMTYSVSGTITFPDMTGTAVAAPGAVVYLAKDASAPTMAYDVAVVADGSGMYSIDNLEAGNYFMFVNYNTANTNTAARVEGINFDSGAGVLFEVSNADVAENILLESAGQAGTMAVNTVDGSWTKDISHSNVDIEFPYDANNASYTARFDKFDIDVNFDAANLTTGSIEASIDLLSFDTSSPGGRDSYLMETVTVDAVDYEVFKYGCVRGYFGVGVDTLKQDAAGNILDPYVLYPNADSRNATFSATGFEVYGDGFMAEGDFTFRGVTQKETIFFRFIEGYEGTNRSGDAIRYSSFEGKLTFSPKSVYGVNSGHLGDADVDVYISFQINKAIL